jgi:hypothetical protein
MNKKFVTYLVLGMVLFGTIATLSASLVVAQGDVEVNSNMYQIKQQAGEQVTYRFRAQTRLRVNSSAPVEVDMDCDAMNVGDKLFSIELTNATEDISLEMTCRQVETQLGVQAGALVRNQNRYQIREGFAIQIQTNLSVQARIGFEMTRGEAIRSSWAYFDDATDEWVPVASSYQDGLLIAETDHFSVWTIVEGGMAAIWWVLIGVGVVSVASLVIILVVRKKRA